MENGKLVLGIVAGAAVGAAIGLLFAPKAGAELRKDIVDKGGEALKGIKEKAMDLVDKGKSKLEDGITKLESGKDAKGDTKSDKTSHAY